MGRRGFDNRNNKHVMDLLVPSHLVLLQPVESKRNQLALRRPREFLRSLQRRNAGDTSAGIVRLFSAAMHAGLLGTFCPRGFPRASWLHVLGA